MAALDVVETPDQAAEQELPPLIVREPLAGFLDAQGLGRGDIEVERIGEGHSNLTFLITRDGERFVIRRPPRPPLPPSAHDVLREARVLAALNQASDRTPDVIATCDDESILGVPFYVMPYVEGTVITGWELPEQLDTPRERRRIADELIDTLAEIHAVDWRAVGLEGFGKPTGYLDRQLRRFGGLWEHNKTREVPALDRVTQWLADNKPESPPATIVHGDYRLGNTMFANDAPARLVAVFDWELSTIGDPLADVGYLTATWAEQDDPDQIMFKLSEVTKREGFPTRDELVARYEELTGRSMSDLRWYQTLALWKSAVFLEGSFKRFQEGTTDDEWFAMLEQGVPTIAEAALEVANSRMPTG